MSAWNLLDFLLIAIIFLSIIAGFKQGFIIAFTSLINTVLAVILALVWYDEGAIFLNEQLGLKLHLTELIRGKLSEAVLAADIPWLSIPINMGLVEIKDAAELLAHFCITIISFSLICFLTMAVLYVLSRLLNKLFSGGILAGINNILGALLVPLRNLIIITIIVGLVFPAVELAARMGLGVAINVWQLMDSSLLLGILLDIFAQLKSLGIAVLGGGHYIN